ncbi:MAG: SUMF1/EgtB/PvdO family nonheme iron enzyme [Vicinamibacterales bacterium]
MDGAAEPNTRVSIPRGRVRLGAAPGSLAFGWDNEFGAIELDVPAFAIDRRDVTNAEFLRFVESGGYTDPQWWTPEDLAWLTEHAITHPGFWAREDGAWSWRGMFQRLPLPPDWPVYVSHAEACAYARWSGGRLPTEADASAPPTALPTMSRAASRGAMPSHAGPRRLRLRQLGSAARGLASGGPLPHGAWTTWWATAGGGRPRRSRRSPASSPAGRIPSTRPTSSTTRTW